MTSGSRYELLPSFLIGFHGTDQKTAEKILSGKNHLAASENDYDWLGHGTYFWEYSPLRAQQFVQEKFKWQGRKEKVAVVGAIIDPGLCLNLLDAKGLSYLEAGYDASLQSYDTCARSLLGRRSNLPGGADREEESYSNLREKSR